MRYENRDEATNVRPERALEALAARQYNVFSHAQAADLGVNRSSIHRRRATGAWEEVEPRVFRVARFPLTPRQPLMAAILSAGPGSAISHRAAARLWRLDVPDDAPIELTVPATSSYRRHVVHRSRALPPVDIDAAGPLPVTTLARTLVDLGAVCPDQVVERALESALRLGLGLHRLEWRAAELGRRGRPGIAALRRVLADRGSVAYPTESELETRFIQLVRETALPEPVRQHTVRADGRIAARVDLAYPESHLAIELDGYRDHSSVDAFRRDRVRQNRLVILGWTVLRFTWVDVVDRPLEVGATLEAALASCSAIAGCGLRRPVRT